MIFLEIFLILLVVYIFLTQISIPLIYNLPLFPLFRREFVLRNKIIEQHGRLAAAMLEQEIAKNEQEILEATEVANEMKSHNTPVDKS